MKKIPTNELPEEYEYCEFINSPLVEVTKEYGFLIEMQYYLRSMKHSTQKCMLRKEVLDKLIEAKNYLPKNITFKIWDAYRPFKLQKELYKKYKKTIINNFNLRGSSKKDKDSIIKRYVALPIKNKNRPPQHTTGGAIDLTLVNLKTGLELDMGTSFDSFSNLTNTDSFEKKGMDKTIRKNRRILYNAMIKAGFTNLPSEWWHYDYGNKNWAYYNKKPAMYNGIFKIDKK